MCGACSCVCGCMCVGMEVGGRGGSCTTEVALGGTNNGPHVSCGCQNFEDPTQTHFGVSAHNSTFSLGVPGFVLVAVLHFFLVLKNRFVFQEACFFAASSPVSVTQNLKF